MSPNAYLLWWWNYNIHQITKLLVLALKKVSLSSAIFSNPNLIKEAKNRVGSQSIVL